MQLDEELQHFRRFHWGWRIAHLVFALVTMTLVLTGTSALFAESSWAPVVASALGGPIVGLIHHVAATLFLSIFLIHLIYVMQKLLRSKTFPLVRPGFADPEREGLC